MASNFNINLSSINTELKKLLLLTNKVLNFVERESDKLVKVLAYSYYAQFLADIRIARYKSPTWKYSDDYADWKRKFGGGLTRYWRMTETLYRSINVHDISSYSPKDPKIRPTQKGYVVGVMGGIMGTRGWKMNKSIEVNKYLYWLEKGNSRQPERPIMFKTFESFKKGTYPNLLNAFKKGLAGTWKL